MQDQYDKNYIRMITLQTNLIVCVDLLKVACSPYVPSTGRDREWLSTRDAVVANALRDLDKADAPLTQPAFEYEIIPAKSTTS
jgi:hypothetical protein